MPGPLDFSLDPTMTDVLPPSTVPPTVAPQAPPVVGQDPRQQLLSIAALGALLGAGPRSGVGVGAGQGLLQQQQGMQHLVDQHAAVVRQQQQQMAVQQQQQQAEASARQRQLQSALMTISQRVQTLPDKDTYDQEIEGYANALKAGGYRLDSNWLRQAVPYVAPTAEKQAARLLDSFFKNPANAQMIKEHPDQLAKAAVSFDVDGDGIPENVPLLRLSQIAKMPFGVDEHGQMLNYAKGTTLDDKANADGFYQDYLKIAKAEGKDITDPNVTAPLRERAIAKAKEAGQLPKEVDPAVEQMRQLNIQLAQQRLAEGAKKSTSPDIQIGSKEYKIASDLADGKLTMQQFRSLYSYSRDINAKTAIYLKASDLNPNFNPAQFEMGYKFASNPKTLNQMASINNVLSGVPDLLKVSDQAKRSGVTILNQAIIRGGIAMGGKRYSNFNTARIAFADELSGALGYGSATDMSREMGFNMTDPNLSPENFRSAVQDIVVPFVERKKASLMGPMGIYGTPDMNPSAGVPTAKPGVDPTLDAAAAILRNRGRSNP